MIRIVIASNNAHKISEIRAILKERLEAPIEVLSLREAGFTEEIEETGSTFEENALIKARTAAKLGYIAIGDDSGLMVDALNGAPGVYSARYAGEPCDDGKNNEKLLRALIGLPPEKRGAKFISTVAIVFPKEGAEYVVQGECPGRILTQPRGNGGFGYDPLFFCEAVGKTFAQLTPEEKNSISHRSASMRKASELLEKKLKEYRYI